MASKQINWKETVKEAESLGQTMFEYIADNTCSAGFSVVDENGEKVTAERWAEVLGMNSNTLRGYIRRSKGTTPTRENERLGTPEVQRRITSDPKFVDRLLSDPQVVKAVASHIGVIEATNEAKMRRANADTPEADRKAAAAHTDRITQGISQAVGELAAEYVWAEQISDVAEEISEYQEHVGKRGLNAITKAYNKLGEEIEVLAARNELEVAQ